MIKSDTVEEKIIRQWDLKNNSIVELLNGDRVKFLKMDGMYAHWESTDDVINIGNFEEFEETDFGYKVFSHPTGDRGKKL